MRLSLRRKTIVRSWRCWLASDGLVNDRYRVDLYEVAWGHYRYPDHHIRWFVIYKQRNLRFFDDRNFPVPDSPLYRTLQFLMEQNGLRQAHLVSIFGSRGRVSEVVNGKRVISKAQAKAMGEFFKVSPE